MVFNDNQNDHDICLKSRERIITITCHQNQDISSSSSSSSSSSMFFNLNYFGHLVSTGSHLSTWQLTSEELPAGKIINQGEK